VAQFENIDKALYLVCGSALFRTKDIAKLYLN